MVVNSVEKGVEIALLEDKNITELHREYGRNKYQVGDILLGKVHKVIPSLNACFVDVGYERDAFLHYLDLGPQFSSMNLYTKRVLKKSQSTSSLADFRTLKDIDKKGKIKDQISANQHILVQVAKEPISNKGPRLTSEITLAGRYIVLVPFSNKISMSSRIENEDERKRLKILLQSIKPKNMGVIVRTVAEYKKVAELDSDLRELVDRWEKLYQNLRNAKPPKTVLGEINTTSKVLRDLLTPEFTNIHVNDPKMSSDIKTYLESIDSGKTDIVKLHKNRDLFDTFKIHKQIKAAFGKQVNLKSGAYLIVEHTEAMHVIDVNSGNRKGGVKNQEENALQTNLECAHEIARILKLRDMGGIICIDFIDMTNSANKKKLYNVLCQAMSTDKAKHNVLSPSRFGVVEITRQRVRPVTDIKTSEKCPTCGGSGKIQASILVTDEIENVIAALAKENKRDLQLHTSPMVDAFINKGFFNSMVKNWRKKYKIKLRTEPQSSLDILGYQFFDADGQEISI